MRITDERPSPQLPRGATAFGVFLIFGTTMALLAATTLLFSGTLLDRVWRLNPRAYEELAPFGKIAGVGFALLAVALALAAVGWFRGARGDGDLPLLPLPRKLWEISSTSFGAASSKAPWESSLPLLSCSIY